MVTLSIGHNGVLVVERSGTLKCRQFAVNWQNQLWTAALSLGA